MNKPDFSTKLRSLVQRHPKGQLVTLCCVIMNTSNLAIQNPENAFLSFYCHMCFNHEGSAAEEKERKVTVPVGRIPPRPGCLRLVPFSAEYILACKISAVTKSFQSCSAGQLWGSADFLKRVYCNTKVGGKLKEEGKNHHCVDKWGFLPAGPDFTLPWCFNNEGDMAMLGQSSIQSKS